MQILRQIMENFIISKVIKSLNKSISKNLFHRSFILSAHLPFLILLKSYLSQESKVKLAVEVGVDMKAELRVVVGRLQGVVSKETGIGIGILKEQIIRTQVQDF